MTDRRRYYKSVYVYVYTYMGSRQRVWRCYSIFLSFFPFLSLRLFGFPFFFVQKLRACSADGICVYVPIAHVRACVCVCLSHFAQTYVCCITYACIANDFARSIIYFGCEVAQSEQEKNSWAFREIRIVPSCI